MQVGDNIRLFLNVSANPDFPVSVDGTVVAVKSTSQLIGFCRRAVTLYSFTYDSDQTGEVLVQSDILKVECISCCEALDVRVTALEEGGGGGAVQSVAGKTGVVTLEIEDIEGLEEELGGFVPVAVALDSEPVATELGFRMSGTFTITDPIYDALKTELFVAFNFDPEVATTYRTAPDDDGHYLEIVPAGSSLPSEWYVSNDQSALIFSGTESMTPVGAVYSISGGATGNMAVINSSNPGTEATPGQSFEFGPRQFTSRTDGSFFEHAGLSGLLPLPDGARVADLEVIIVEGQSWAVGTESIPVDNDEPHPFHLGPDTHISYAIQDPSQVVPLQEREWNGRGEVGATAMVNRLDAEWSKYAGEKPRYLVFAPAVPGASYVDLKKGSVSYTTMLETFDQIAAYCEERNWTWVCRAVSWFQIDATAANLQEFQNDIETDIQAKNPSQTQDVRLYVNQVSYNTANADLAVTNYQKLILGSVTVDGLNSGKIRFLATSYDLPTVAPSAIHFPASGSAIIGTRTAEAYIDEWVNEGYRGGIPSVAAGTAGEIRIGVQTTSGPPMIDIYKLGKITDFGFRLVNGDGSNIPITSVQTLYGQIVIQWNNATTPAIGLLKLRYALDYANTRPDAALNSAVGNIRLRDGVQLVTGGRTFPAAPYVPSFALDVPGPSGNPLAYEPLVHLLTINDPVKPLRGLYEDANCAVPATDSADFVMKFRDELLGTRWTANGDPTTPSLRPQLYFDGSSEPFLSFYNPGNQTLDIGDWAGGFTYTMLVRSQTPTWNSYFGLIEKSVVDSDDSTRLGIFNQGTKGFVTTDGPSLVRYNGVAATAPAFTAPGDITQWTTITVTTHANPAIRRRGIAQREGVDFGGIDVRGIAIYKGTPTLANIQAVESYFETLK